MYSFCDEQLPPDECNDVRLLLLRVWAIWRGEANALSFKFRLEGISTHRQIDGRWVFCFANAICEDRTRRSANPTVEKAWAWAAGAKLLEAKFCRCPEGHRKAHVHLSFRAQRGVCFSRAKEKQIPRAKAALGMTLSRTVFLESGFAPRRRRQVVRQESAKLPKEALFLWFQWVTAT